MRSYITFEKYAALKMSTCRLIFEKSCVSKMRTCWLTFKKNTHFKYKYIRFSDLSIFDSGQFWVHDVLKNKHFCLRNKKPSSNSVGHTPNTAEKFILKDLAFFVIWARNLGIIEKYGTQTCLITIIYFLYSSHCYSRDKQVNETILITLHKIVECCIWYASTK